MFTPWKCGDCGAHGKIRHESQHTAADISRWTMQQHGMKSPACHKAAMERLVKEARESSMLKPRDLHILTTARMKRKLVVDAIRVQRTQGRDAAVATFCDRWNLIPATLTREERITAWAATVDVTRKEWLAGRKTRKGYAFT